MTDTLGGQTDFVFTNPPSALSLLKTNKMRALAITSAKRLPLLPDVPTVAESGYPGFEAGDWKGVVTPMRVPASVIEELNATIVHDDLTYRHRWSPGQLIVWDNRCVLHRATAYDPARERRVIRRCTVLGEVPQ